LTAKARKVVVVTGGSGVVGQDLLARLRQDFRVIALAHNDTDLLGVEVLRCDIAQPQLGLSDDEWADLANVADVIVHSAAITTWGLPKDRYRSVNIDGTRHVVELARRAEAPIHLISSSFVQALESPRCEEILGPTNVVYPYIWSKREAERIVRESGLPYGIYRATNLVGHSTTGASSRPQIVQATADWIARGKAPYFPAHPGNLLDIAPIDAVSCAVVGAIEASDSGQELWITYGHESLTVDEAMREIVDHARSLGRSVDLAPIVDPRTVPPVAIEDVPAMSRPFLKVLIDVSEVTHASGGVLPSSLAMLRTKYGASGIGCAEAFRQSLKYWAAQRQI
jgi:nucleoside-diphosphate-sugar epimerase